MERLKRSGKTRVKNKSVIVSKSTGYKGVREMVLD